MIVGSAVGGGYDLFARVVARHLVNHIPGNPHILVQNQPTAGGVVMTNQLYNQGPKDGTVIGVPINGIPTAPLLQAGTQFDQTRLTWIGSTNREAYVAFVWHSAPVRSIAELTSKEVVVGATTPGTTMVDFPQLVNEVLGFKFKIVRGYQGTPQINLAIERGEVQAWAAWAGLRSRRRPRTGSASARSGCSRNTASSDTRNSRMSRPCSNLRDRMPTGRQ
jgi:tripartite-type tricarboxylate transporter receptor subunit TctC